MWMIALKILKDNWQWVAIGVLVLFLWGYIASLKLSRDHYKEKYEVVTKEFTLFKTKAKEEAEAFKASAKAISETANAALAEKNRVIFKQQEELIKKVRNDKAISNINVPSASIRLLNESTNRPATTGDSKGTSQEASPSQASTIPLTLVFEIVVENNTNHQQCIDQVLALQRWYNDLRVGSFHNENSP